jgi:hypothetical protein
VQTPRAILPRRVENRLIPISAEDGPTKISVKIPSNSRISADNKINIPAPTKKTYYISYNKSSSRLI